MNVASTRVMFLSSENGLSGDGRILNFNIPAPLLNYPTVARLQLGLNTFTSAKTWYSLNQFNGTFYVANLNPAFYKLHEIKIPNGNYTNLSQLASTIEYDSTGAISTNGFDTGPLGNAISDVVNTSNNFSNASNNYNWVVLFDEITEIFKIYATSDPPTAAAAFQPPAPIVTTDIQFFCFSIQGSVSNSLVNSDISPAGRYNDVDQVLGASTNRSIGDTNNFATLLASLTPMFNKKTPDDGIWFSKFPANLQTLDALYLRVKTLPTNNIESVNLAIEQKGDFVVSSDIFAKILIPTDTTSKFIEFVDPNQNFTIEVQASQLTTIILELTDDKNRLIPLVNENEANSVSFSVSIKITEYQI